jgi:hypothetical protein
MVSISITPLMNVALKKKETEKKEEQKTNASERINLQHIMELREKFEAADTDNGDSLD